MHCLQSKLLLAKLCDKGLIQPVCLVDAISLFLPFCHFAWFQKLAVKTANMLGILVAMDPLRLKLFA